MFDALLSVTASAGGSWLGRMRCCWNTFYTPNISDLYDAYTFRYLHDTKTVSRVHDTTWRFNDSLPNAVFVQHLNARTR